MNIPKAIASIVRNQYLLLKNPTVASASTVNAHSSGIPNISIKLVYQGSNKNTKQPQSKPFTVDVVTAALIAYPALPCCASGKAVYHCSGGTVSTRYT